MATATAFRKHTNWGVGSLAAPHVAGSGIIQLMPGDVAEFGAPTPEHPIALTVAKQFSALSQGMDSSNGTIFECTNIVGNTLTVQVVEGTIDRDYSPGDLVFCSPTAGDMDQVQDALNNLEESAATEDWVLSQDYATESYVDSAIAAIPPVTPTQPAAPNGAVQYNNAGSFGGDGSFLYDKITNTLTATNLVGSGTGLTNLSAANLATGTVNTARLGSGIASSSTYLRGDNIWAVPPVPAPTPPAGIDGQIQYNLGGVFTASAGLTWNPATGTFRATNITGDGGGLTNLNASAFGSGTVPTARLGSGTANTTTFLRGDSTWQTLPASGAPTTSKYIVQGTVDAALTGAQFLGALATGILKNTTSTGVLSIATGADIPNIAESQVTNLVTDLAAKAPLASPALTGTPTAPTATAGTNTTQLATTAYVLGQGFITTAPVTSVATKTGAVTLAQADIAGLTTSSSPTFAGITIDALGGTLKATAGVVSSAAGSDLNTTFGSQTQNFVYSAPSAANGVPGFRLLVTGDIPVLDAAKITTGTLATARLGSGTANTTTFLRGDSTWQTIAGGAPVASKYIVQGTTDASLTGAQFLGALATGIVKNTTTTGVLSIAAGSDFNTTFGSQTQNFVYSAPSASAGVLGFRLLVSGDIPVLDTAKITTGTLATARLGSGTANTTTFLRGDSTWQSVATTPGGSNTQVQYNASGVLSGSANYTWNNSTNVLTISAGTLNISQGTMVTGTPAIDSYSVWNNSAISFSHWNINITDLASSAGSLLQQMSVGGSAKWSIDKTGKVIAGQADATFITSGTVATARLGSGTANTTTFLRGDSTWQTIAGGAPAASKYIVQGTTDASLTGAQFLGALTTGLLKNTTTTGILSIAAGADIPNIAESQVTNLVTDLAAKAPLASPALTGTPTAPTATAGTNTTQLATTAFVLGQGFVTTTTAPVRSVAGKTGVVTLVQADVGGLTTASSPTFLGLTVGNNGISVGNPTSGTFFADYQVFSYTYSNNTASFSFAPWGTTIVAEAGAVPLTLKGNSAGVHIQNWSNAAGTTLSFIDSAGVFTGSGAGLTTLNASNLSSGTVPATCLPNPSATTLGGIQSIASVANQWIDSVSTAGVPHLSQPAFSNLSGTITTAQVPNSAITYAKIQNLSAVTLLGNPTGSAAAPSEVALGSGLSFSGTTLAQRGGVVWSLTAPCTAVANTAAESSVLSGGTFTGSRTIPANSLRVGDILRFGLAGAFGATGTPAMTWSLYLGATKFASGFNTASGAATAGVVNDIYRLEYQVQAIGSGGKILGTGCIHSARSGSGACQVYVPTTTTPIGSGGAQAPAQVGIDTTVDLDFDLRLTWNAASTLNTLQVLSAYLLIIPGS